MATIRDVAALANVSPATVSRVMNGNVTVAKKTRESVLRAIQELDYSPAKVPSEMERTGKFVGVLVKHLASPYYWKIISGVENSLKDQNIEMIVSRGEQSFELEKKALELLIHRRCDALILYLENIGGPDILELAQQGYPIVMLNRRIPEFQSNSVYLDNEYGGYLATKHLIDCGHRQIAHIATTYAAHSARDRLAGYHRALREAGLLEDEHLVVEGIGYSEKSGFDSAKRLLSRKQPFTAIFAGNDNIASGVINCLQDHDIRVPDDVSIIGFDDHTIASYLLPPLTTLNAPMEEIGKAAGHLICQLLNGDDGVDIQRRFMPTLVERNSVISLK